MSNYTQTNDLSQKETNFPLSKQNTDNQSYKRLKSLSVFHHQRWVECISLRHYRVPANYSLTYTFFSEKYM